MNDHEPILVCRSCSMHVPGDLAFHLPINGGELLCCPKCCRLLEDLESIPQQLPDDIEIHPAALKDAEDHDGPPPPSDQEFSQHRPDQEDQTFI